MAPPTVHDESEDLDDLDDVLDQFNPSSTSTSTSQTAPSSTSRSNPPPPPTAPPPSFPDPDDDELPGTGLDNFTDEDLAGLDPAIAKDLEQGMKALFDAFGNQPGGAIPGLEGEDGDGDFDDEEFRKAMEEIIKNGGAGGAPGEGAGVDTKELRDLMAALGMGGATSADGPAPTGKPSTTTTKQPLTSTTTTNSTKGKDKDSTSAPPPAAANFQDAIAASLNKMQSSSTNASQAAQQSQSQAENGNIASMLAGLSGMPDLSQLGDLGSEEGLQGMLDEMMKQLMSREMLYEPLKELSEKYPAYLISARSTLSATDLERYEKQHSIVVSIVQKFQEPGADKPLEQQTEQEKERSSERTDEIVDLVAKMNDCGAPPKEIMGEMPPGMEMGPDGNPKIPECTIC